MQNVGLVLDIWQNRVQVVVDRGSYPGRTEVIEINKDGAITFDRCLNRWLEFELPNNQGPDWMSAQKKSALTFFEANMPTQPYLRPNLRKGFRFSNFTPILKKESHLYLQDISRVAVTFT